MDFLREIVGGKKKRHIEKDFNLDLTYITPRLIAMAFPATGIQKLYRNPAQVVRQFFEYKHKGNYITINLSNRIVDDKILKNVSAFTWEDHKPPSLETLFVVCQTIIKFLSKQSEGVSVVHCNHGKGRTGTLISCLLLYSGIFETAAEAMKFYSDKRFQKEGLGVTQPGQITYVKYFNKLLKNPKLRPQVLYIRKITFTGGHNLNEPYLKLRNTSNNDELFCTKKNNNVLVTESQNDKKTTWMFSTEILFAGDFLLEIKQESKIGKNYVGGYHFNTTFVPEAVEVPLTELSPHALATSNTFDLDFIVEIHFRNGCKCQPTSSIASRCQKCRQKLVLEQQKFAKIEEALKLRQQQLALGKQLLYGKNPQNLSSSSQKKN